MVKHNYKYTFYKTTYSFLYIVLLTDGGFFLATHQNHHNQFWAFITQQLNYSY